MKQFKYIVFDFDGTLADSKAVFISIYNELAAKHGYTAMTDDNLEHLRGLSIKERCRYLKVPLYRVPFMVAAVLKQYKHAVASLGFSEGMQDVLESLKSDGIPYAVLSTNSKQNIQEFFRIKGITGANDIYCSRSVFGKHVLLNKFLKQKSLKSSDVLYIGDEARDIIACRKSGVAVAWVTWGYDSPASIKNYPDYIIHEPAQLLELARQ